MNQGCFFDIVGIAWPKKSNPQDRELLKRFQLFGPPGTIFFDAKGIEVADTRVIGYQNSQRFLQTLSRAGL